MSRESENATLIATQLDLLAKYAASADKQYWKQFKHVRYLFISLRPLERRDRDRLEQRYDAIRRSVQESKRQWDKAASRHSIQIKSRLDKLEGDYFPDGPNGRPHLKPAFWEEARRIGEAIRDAPELRTKYRNEFRARLNQCYDRVHGPGNVDRSLGSDS